MAELSGFPYFEVQFDKKGQVHDPSEVAKILDFLAQGDTTDLFAISHGWNNDMADARRLYQSFFARVRATLDGGQSAAVGGRKIAILAVLWPSKKFTDQELIPSGAASLGSPVTDEFLEAQVDDLRPMFDDPAAGAVLDDAKRLIPKLEDSPSARRELADKIRSLLPRESADGEDVPEELFALPGDELIERLGEPVSTSPDAGNERGGAAGLDLDDDQPAAFSGGGVAGSAAGLGDVFTGIKAGASNLLNLTTYYTMKERAGTVGSQGLNPVLRQIRQRRPDLKIHLIGHSFGGRLVTAAALGADGQEPVRVESMTLLQAAFSHYGFSGDYGDGKPGFFRQVVTEGRVRGPILVSNSAKDKAVGLAYPLASRIARQVASALGDKDDRYGGIGRNGAQKTAEAVEGKLLAVGGAYAFEGGKLYNLNGDDIILGHSDIAKDEVAHALLTAVAGT